MSSASRTNPLSLAYKHRHVTSLKQKVSTTASGTSKTVCRCRFKSFSGKRSQLSAANLTSHELTGWAIDMVCLYEKACCAVEKFPCQSDEDSVCLHIETHAECQPAIHSVCVSVFTHCCCHSSSSPRCHFGFLLFCAVARRPFSFTLSLALLCPSLLFLSPLSLCFLSEWYRRSVPQPHSSLWQPQPPDKRKQILQQEPDINGLSCFFSCHVFSFILVPSLGRRSYSDITPCKSIKSSIRKTLQYCKFYWPPHSSLSGQNGDIARQFLAPNWRIWVWIVADTDVFRHKS